MTQTHIVMLALAPFIAWRLYKRMRQLTVRQQSRIWRHWIPVVLFPAGLVGLAAVMASRPMALGAMVGGAIAGTMLGLLALRRTVFEKVGSDYFYTPCAPVGLLIAMLLIGRLLYRGLEFYLHGPAQMPSFGRSPLTLAIFGTMALYYAVYGIGLLRWRKTERTLEVKR